MEACSIQQQTLPSYYCSVIYPGFSKQVILTLKRKQNLQCIYT